MPQGNRYIDPRTWATTAQRWFAEEKRLQEQAERDRMLLSRLNPSWTEFDLSVLKSVGVIP